jgi:hypothetical protein
MATGHQPVAPDLEDDSRQVNGDIVKVWMADLNQLIDLCLCRQFLPDRLSRECGDLELHFLGGACGQDLQGPYCDGGSF